MRVLILSKYGRLAASTRYRHEQFLPHLRRGGLEVDVSPLLGDAYLRHKFASGRAPLMPLAVDVLRRLKALLVAGKYDLVIVHCEIAPYLPPVFEKLLELRGIPYIYDFDDAIFHQYDEHRNPLVRAVLGKKIAAVIRGAKAVMAGNRYLAEYASRVNSNVHIFPTVVDLDQYKACERGPRDGTLTIGWVGSPSTAKYVKDIEGALRTFCAQRNARVVLIGSGPMTMSGVPLVVKEWDEKTEISELKRFDIGIMPLSDDAWSRGKCGFKLIQYMAAELPVVASPVGFNAELVSSGEDGLLATTDAEWVRALESLATDPAARERMGKHGLEKVQRRYSLAVQAPRLVELIRAQGSGVAPAASVQLNH